MPLLPRGRRLAGAVGLSLTLALGASTIVSAAAAPADPTTTASTTRAVTAPGGSSARGPAVPRLTWASCGAGLEAFQCATALVPRDYDRPRGKLISIALTRLPATDQKRRIGSLFTNPGGPGGSGVDFVQQAGPYVYADAVRARFDIVGFDPRGVARSTPATCYDSPAEEQQATAGFLPFPLTRADRPRYDRESAQLARACAETSPQRFRHISTANVARDLDLLRRAVGDDKLSYAGYSYGTFLGATYAKLFPGRIRAMVLDGTIDPREYSGTSRALRTVPTGNRIEQDRGGAEVFEQFLTRCEAAGPQRCSLAALGDPAELSRGLLDALKQRPVQLSTPSGPVTITYQLAVATAYSSLYSATQWSDLADLLSVLALATGQAQPIAASPRTLSASVAAMVEGARLRGQDYASFGGSIGSTCVDTVTPPRRVFAAAADAADRRFPDFGRYRTWVGYVCTYFRAEGIRDADAYTGPWRQTTRARVLVLGTRHDPATPYRNTRPYASLFPRASVLTLEGWGHTTLGQSGCVDDRVASYLLRPNRSRGDATCATQVLPFTTPGTDQRSRAASAAARTH
jgi:pimeloyl-ACP methyl ester carboxylesterase